MASRQGSAPVQTAGADAPAVRAKRVWAAGGRQTCSQKLRVSVSIRQPLRRVPWFHENALLLVVGRGDYPGHDAVGCAAGEERGAAVRGRKTFRGIKAGPRIAPVPTGCAYPRTRKSRGVRPITDGIGRRTTPRQMSRSEADVVDGTETCFVLAAGISVARQPERRGSAFGPVRWSGDPES